MWFLGDTYCAPRCAISYSSSSSYYLLYCHPCPACPLLTHFAIAIVGYWSAFCCYCVAGYHWWYSILASPSAAAVALGTPARHRRAYQHHQQQCRHVLYQDHLQHNIHYQEYCQHHASERSFLSFLEYKFVPILPHE